MPDETGAIVPVTDANKDQMVQVNDVWNRALRSGQNMTPLSALVLIANKWGPVDIDVTDVVIFLQFVVPAVAGVRRWLEIRRAVLPKWLAWIVFSPPPPGAGLALPVNAAGEPLGQLKTS